LASRKLRYDNLQRQSWKIIDFSSPLFPSSNIFSLERDPHSLWHSFVFLSHSHPTQNYEMLQSGVDGQRKEANGSCDSNSTFKDLQDIIMNGRML